MNEGRNQSITMKFSSTGNLPQASYYSLYANAKEITSSSKKLDSDKPDSINTSNNKGVTTTNTSKNTMKKDETIDNNSNAFWEEFNFTNEEKQKLQSLLDENISKCDVIENAPTQKRGQYLIHKYEHEANTKWDNFYTSHQTNFFKDRHYLNKAFHDDFGVVYETNSGGEFDHERQMVAVNSNNEEDFTIIEIGCGVGNTLLPLLELKPFVYIPVKEKGIDDELKNIQKEQLIKKRLVIHGFDFSSVAINLLQKDPRFINANCDNNRSISGVWDITQSKPDLYSKSDISLLLFVMSAISPSKMVQAAQNAANTLKPGGILLLRDYGRYDEAQMKLGCSRNKRLGNNFYVKSDGTRCYYFMLEDIAQLFGGNGNVTSIGNKDKNEDAAISAGAGLEILELKYVQRVYKNRANETSRRRIWVQGRFRKPLK